ncbi:catalase family protein [Sphingomonas montanisoli]|uniref:Catalase family protein n=1 Tax=Sphingomonas montanisoli TaxID=2606412 RepID=A0A5D9C907_9SPHN|nr:catalase family protein [Sphingomonas montanisoli]TZG27632.1 catalase family protein [Sphingomonas montanisoli]
MTPVRYTPDVETIEPDEAEVQAELIETFRSIQETTHADSGHGFRGVHAKSHALLQGSFTVLDDLPAELAQGLFATPGRHDALIRISTGAGDVLPDSISLLRGIGIKVLDVGGDRLEGSEGDSTQDFLLANGIAFPAPGPKKFLGNLKLLAKTTDKVEGLKKAVSAVFRTLEKGVEAVGGESGFLEQLGGHRHTHPLGETFFSQAPIRYGDYIAKLGLFPLSPNFTALADEEIDIDGRDNALREEIGSTLARDGGAWELRVQLCRDLEANPIEDASVAWPEEDNPYIAVARIEVPAQAAWNDARARILDDQTSFNPWHGIQAHRPLGAVMRARKPVYAASVETRSRFNGCPIHEPRHADLPA